jgi:hypothetical protein
MYGGVVVGVSCHDGICASSKIKKQPGGLKFGTPFGSPQRKLEGSRKHRREITIQQSSALWKTRNLQARKHKICTQGGTQPRHGAPYSSNHHLALYCPTKQ